MDQYDRISPQSGHRHVTPLHVNPQAFSSLHAWHIWKPQRQVRR